jgi:CBS domain-containing protein
VATLVRDIMERNPVSVSSDTKVEDVLRVLREHELPGVPVVDDDGLCVGIVTEADLIIPDPEGDLHLPHYIELFGGIVFLEPLRHFEDALRKAFAAKASDMMTADPDVVGPEVTAQEAGRKIHTTGHNRLPVVEEDGRLVGVVTRFELLGALAAE